MQICTSQQNETRGSKGKEYYANEVKKSMCALAIIRNPGRNNWDQGYEYRGD